MIYDLFPLYLLATGTMTLVCFNGTDCSPVPSYNDTHLMLTLYDLPRPWVCSTENEQTIGRISTSCSSYWLSFAIDNSACIHTALAQPKAYNTSNDILAVIVTMVSVFVILLLGVKISQHRPKRSSYRL